MVGVVKEISNYDNMSRSGFEGSDGNSAVKIDGGGGKELYLNIVKIGNFHQILMSLRDVTYIVGFVLL